jgi:hypothetical protein
MVSISEFDYAGQVLFYSEKCPMCLLAKVNNCTMLCGYGSATYLCHKHQDLQTKLSDIGFYLAMPNSDGNVCHAIAEDTHIPKKRCTTRRKRISGS